MAWTDERLEERFDRIDDRFDEVDRRFSEVYRRFDQAERTTGARFDEVYRHFEKADLRFNRIEDEMREVRRTLHRVGVGVIVGLVGVIAAIFINGSPA